MSSSVSVITGLKWATFDQPRADQVTGRLNGEPQAIMHAFTPLKNNARGYAYLSASLQKVEEFEKIALDERGRGAVSGGYVTAMTITSAGRLARGTTVNEQEWEGSASVAFTKPRMLGISGSWSALTEPT